MVPISLAHSFENHICGLFNYSITSVYIPQKSMSYDITLILQYDIDYMDVDDIWHMYDWIADIPSGIRNGIILEECLDFFSWNVSDIVW